MHRHDRVFARCILSFAALRSSGVCRAHQAAFFSAIFFRVSGDRGWRGRRFCVAAILAIAKHGPIIDIATFDRVQVLLGNKTHHRHDSVYGNGLITCGHCGRPVLCETKRKAGREYQYYRCSIYHKGDHPRERITGAELDKQMLTLFDKLKIEDK